MDFLERYEQWLSASELTDAERARLSAMTDAEKKECFWAPLEFGTAGMRGVIDLGVNRMNRFTVGRATKGLADYICSLGEDAKKRGVVIARDTRRKSDEFAVLTAKILAANGIRAYLFEDVRPVPMCSFAIRHLKAEAGVMITASHNPKIYNGYKVYGADGAQMSPESTDKVVEFIERTPYFGVKALDAAFTPESVRGLDGVEVAPLITVIGASVDSDYFAAVEKLGLSPDAVKEFGGKVRIVYTPVHGTGYMPVTKVLAHMGISVTVVPEQAKPDTEFSTVRVPNPEEADTLALGVRLADEIGSDVVIGTDPDADRMGVAIRDDKGEFVLLNGNQIGSLMTEYILRRRKESGTLPGNGAVVKTIVTTELARKIAAQLRRDHLRRADGLQVSSARRSRSGRPRASMSISSASRRATGRLSGTHARDKDAVAAAMIFAEMICYYDSVHASLWAVLQELYKKFGFFAERSASVAFGGVDGMDRMRGIMQKLRDTSFDEICGTRVEAASDLVAGVKRFADGREEPTGLPATNALKLHLAGGDWICARPSGTEPKLKFYAAASALCASCAEERAQAYLAFMKKFAE